MRRRYSRTAITLVPCPGCIWRGVKQPALVKPGYQCNACADIEEGAF